MKVRPVKVQVPIGEILEKFNANFEYISRYLVNRTEELNAVKLCMLTKGHLLLDGPPGVAKSLLARLCFKVVSGDTDPLVVYRKQFMPNTMPEEVFGAMNVQKFKEESIMEFNTAKMLPEAHFAYLDEIYRASDSLLPSMMGILNERLFFNGSRETRCPLETAIATTNFISDRPELEAFQDRWLITHKVRSADSPASRRSILDIFLNNTDEDEIAVADPSSLSELHRMQKAVTKVSVPNLMFELFEQMVSQYRSAMGGCYISDRRYCQAFRLVQAGILLETDGEPTSNPPVSCIIPASMAIVRSQDKEHLEAIQQSIGTVIGNYERAEKEEPEISAFEEGAARQLQQYDPSMSPDRKRRMLERVTSALERISALAPDEQFTISRNVDRLLSVTKKLEELQFTLQSDLVTKF